MVAPYHYVIASGSRYVKGLYMPYDENSSDSGRRFPRLDQCDILAGADKSAPDNEFVPREEYTLAEGKEVCPIRVVRRADLVRQLRGIIVSFVFPVLTNLLRLERTLACATPPTGGTKWHLETGRGCQFVDRTIPSCPLRWKGRRDIPSSSQDIWPQICLFQILNRPFHFNDLLFQCQ